MSFELLPIAKLMSLGLSLFLWKCIGHIAKLMGYYLLPCIGHISKSLVLYTSTFFVVNTKIASAVAL